MSKQELYSLTIDGQEVHAIPDSSIIQAYAHAGHALTGLYGAGRLRLLSLFDPQRG